MNDIGKNIKAKREQLGITQEDLALALGYKSKTSINKIEMGLADVPRAKLPAFARALGVTPDELSGWTAEHKASSFSYCIEQQLRVLGYTVIYDMEGNVVLKYEGERYEITDENLKELERRMVLFLKLGMQEIIEKSGRAKK
jgi:transcriptional regulator with XRE-family HTH domain